MFLLKLAENLITVKEFIKKYSEILIPQNNPYFSYNSTSEL